ncbi:MarR family winged helix-turn-helix transcriptional regulator [Niallia sp. NCCP-28]|uniref:MarR family winged helix-turn-helix transcriptional regulator n=1 Tax=Niallia sp. NCCP-28 TaxID=2934712 RepID=UPI0020854B62|nr:MarR family transcriptional regulator [Niallia sp. NCCP-28]GKU85055.1 MarR family transcriptional regulator [Niallia sp. NCCP-28]
MGKKIGSEDFLPPLGIDPYIELIQESASKEVIKQDAQTGLMMLWLSDFILDAVDVELEPFGITESKLDLLLLLTLYGEKKKTPSSLAERLGISRASLTSMIDWLEKRKLVERTHCANDRRKVHVHITEEGRNVVNKVLPTYWSFCASIVQDLEPAEKQVFEKVIKKLIGKMQERLEVER